MEEIITISKFRITDATTVKGLNELSKKSGKEMYQLVREILHDYFTGELTKSTTTTAANLDDETLDSIKNTEIATRILLKKIFDLNEDEYKALIKKAKRKDA